MTISSTRAQARSSLTPHSSWPFPYVIAIDGPAGAGKSSVSKRVADSLGFLRLDTGVIYRAVAFAALHQQVQPTMESALNELLTQFKVQYEDEHLILGGVRSDDPRLRSPEISRAASDYATLPAVRAHLLESQRILASSAPCIVDGRDIGTVVFPDAPLKIFLTASVEERARRRCLELDQRGISRDLERVCAEIAERDRQDRERVIAPLKCAEDAQVIDATLLTLEEVVTHCVELAREVFPVLT